MSVDHDEFGTINRPITTTGEIKKISSDKRNIKVEFSRLLKHLTPA